VFHIACDADIGAVYKVRVGIQMNDDALHSDTELTIVQVCIATVLFTSTACISGLPFI